jgi:hypothetical protein
LAGKPLAFAGKPLAVPPAFVRPPTLASKPLAFPGNAPAFAGKPLVLG